MSLIYLTRFSIHHLTLSYFFETTPAVPDSCFSRVMRVLVCDPDGKYPWEPGCESGYAEQLSEGEKREMAQIIRQRN